jgi:hypothetical protein
LRYLNRRGFQFPREKVGQELDMEIYYFDTKDGVPVRDRTGFEFVDGSAAIEHSRELAAKVRAQSPAGKRDLYIAVLDGNGREIHREQVYPGN